MVGLTSVGIAQAALDKAVAYAKERRQHGKPIGAHQLIQGMLAEAAIELDAAKLLVYRAFNLIDHGARCEVESAMAKCYATEIAVDVASKAVQIHGGNGITKDFGVELLFRNARMMTIPDGTTEIQKLIIGRALTGLNAFS
jgi:alkylation response protein AidB-like acyl-CoA dehydrogenase